jgi:hypothetical protein
MTAVAATIHSIDCRLSGDLRVHLFMKGRRLCVAANVPRQNVTARHLAPVDADEEPHAGNRKNQLRHAFLPLISLGIVA